MSDNNGLYREKSMKRLSSPEQLNDYLRVTNPGTWVILGTVIFLLTSLIIWSSFASVQSFAKGTAQAEDGVLSISFENLQTAEKVEEGMTLYVGDTRSTITSVGKDEYGRIIAAANANVPDGTYTVKVGYRQSRIVEMLFN